VLEVELSSFVLFYAFTFLKKLRMHKRIKIKLSRYIRVSLGPKCRNKKKKELLYYLEIKLADLKTSCSEMKMKLIIVSCATLIHKL